MGKYVLVARCQRRLCFFFPHLRLFVDLRLHGAPKFSQVCPFLNAVVISPVDLSILHVFFVLFL